jgi:hypothetical protein
MAVIAAPVSAEPGTNVFNDIMLPAVDPVSAIDQLEIANNGDLYASVGRTDTGDPVPPGVEQWWLEKSVDGGKTWTHTALNPTKIGDEVRITAIAAAPDSDMIYVAVKDVSGPGGTARVWKCPNGAMDDPYPIQALIDSSGVTEAEYIYDLEVWSDGTNNWVLAATDIDVLVLRDGLFEPWRDMDLSSSFDPDGLGGGTWGGDAYKAKFDPNFDTSFLLWALIDVYDVGSTGEWEFVLTCTGANSPGQWGTVIQDCTFEGYTDMTSTDPRVDFEFATGYDNDAPIIFAALNDGGGGSTGDGNLFMCEFAYVVAAPAMLTEWTALLVANRGMCSVEIANNLILGGALLDNILLISVNNGDTFDEPTKAPTGRGQVRIYLPDNYDPETDTAFCLTRRSAYDESALSWSFDGCETWNQVAFIDTTIDAVLDMTWSPDFPAGSYMLLLTYSADSDTLSLWRTENGTDAAPFWERVFCALDSTGGSSSKGNFFLDEDDTTLIKWSLDGSTVMLYGEDDEDPALYKSGDNAQTFIFWRDLPADPDMVINDWVVLDGVTFYAATNQGFYGKSAYGPPTLANPAGGALVSIDVQPGFDPTDASASTIVVGDSCGMAYVSANAGQDWGLGNLVGSGDVLVAFDQMDPSRIYYAPGGSTVGTAVIKGLGLDKIGDLEDSLDMTATVDGFTGLWVAPGTLDNGGNVLYAIGGDPATSETIYTIYAWGMIQLDLVPPSGAYADSDPGAEQVDIGSIDLTGNSSANTDTVSLQDFSISTDSGVFVDAEALNISGTLTAITSSIVAGTLTIVSDGAGTGTGTVEVAFTGLSGFTAGETVSIVENGGDPLSMGTAYDYPWVAVMGAEVTITETGLADGDTPAVLSSGLYVDDTFPTVVSGWVGIQNPVTGKGTFNESWDANFGFENDDLGMMIEEIDGNYIELVEEETVSPVSSAEAFLFRILIGEEDNEWETRQIDGAVGLWGTKGSNIVWTIVDGSEVWALHDTMATSVKGVTVSGVMENSASVSWTALAGADMYEYKWDSTRDFTVEDETTATIPGLDDNTDYSVMVRVPAGYPFQSRWSTSVDFTTLEAIATPANIVPDNGEQGISTLPSFVWGMVGNAVTYEFQLSTDPAFGSTIVDISIDAPLTAYTCTVPLAYDTNHYWRVRAISATGRASNWCFSNFHTMVEPIDPVTIEPAPTPTINLPQPTVSVNIPDITVNPPAITVEPPVVTVPITTTQTTVNPVIEMPDEPTPVYIWIIVAIGAILTIAVIVLIIRTRRVV